eukprot:CAMPEP_0196727026 /NCGR_PEP_ID=MMETSP1091-20130531/8115_1 /TAXON_ID=302021 /ORGANISM="Rhodomonas sp., Strain CCMP768" /LENGTH=228 /DNA_ID=CAMNT_0042069549 /DNA_START=153 /DNA_END=839 /DNA_ORIENTATION=-
MRLPPSKCVWQLATDVGGRQLEARALTLTVRHGPSCAEMRRQSEQRPPPAQPAPQSQGTHEARAVDRPPPCRHRRRRQMTHRSLGGGGEGDGVAVCCLHVRRQRRPQLPEHVTDATVADVRVVEGHDRNQRAAPDAERLPRSLDVRGRQLRELHPRDYAPVDERLLHRSDPLHRRACEDFVKGRGAEHPLLVHNRHVPDRTLPDLSAVVDLDAEEAAPRLGLHAGEGV